MKKEHDIYLKIKEKSTDFFYLETNLKRTELALAESETKYRTLFDHSIDAIFLLKNNIIIDCNLQSLKMFRCIKEDLMGPTSFLKVSPPYQPDGSNSEKRGRELIELALQTGYLEFEWKHRRFDQSVFDAEVRLFKVELGGEVYLQAVVRDISDRKKIEEEANLQKAYFQQLFENSPEAIAIVDIEDRIVNINKGFEKLFGYKLEEAKGQLINDLIVPRSQYLEAINFTRNVLSGCLVQKESIRKNKYNNLINVSILAYPILANNNRIGAFAIYSDITERKQAEDQLRYLSLYDALTGLFNRTYFEQVMRRFKQEDYWPISIIVCDLAGLKFVNDTLGHSAGDLLLINTARIIKNSFRKNDFVARIGGDEFAILLPNSSRSNVEKSCQRLAKAFQKYNQTNPDIPLHVSLGFALGENPTQSINDLFKQADNNMYREKLHRSQSTRSSIVQTLTKALEARDYITEGHAERLTYLVAGLAAALNLPQRQIAELRLLAQFHDIGKVGISDRILNKPGPLTRDEKEEMQKHCEIGYRIAQSAPDLLPIADWILKHHEWWNGQGYPLGLKGPEIPLECRVLSIADAYDAMTNQRPYRPPLTHEEALAELKRCSGLQFDPDLVERFIMITQIEEENT